MDLKSILAILKKFWVEALLLGLALLTTIFSLIIYLGSQKEVAVPPIEVKKVADSGVKTFAAEISGAVVKPGVYELKAGARLKDLVEKSGGLSTSADKEFFGRNFNLSRLVADQEKIHIPTRQEVLNGLFVEQPKAVDPNSGSQSPASSPQSGSGKISINGASATELDSLPGVGKTTAEKIISLRPYGNVDELLNKKAISQNVFDQIKDLVSLN